jgi:hypothetical protein
MPPKMPKPDSPEPASEPEAEPSESDDSDYQPVQPLTPRLVKRMFNSLKRNKEEMTYKGVTYKKVEKKGRLYYRPK